MTVGFPSSPTFAGQISSLSSKLDDHIKSLWVILDSSLNLENGSIYSFFFFRSIAKITHYLVLTSLLSSTNMQLFTSKDVN